MLFNQWGVLQSRFEELSRVLSGSFIDVKERHVLQKELSQLSTILEKRAAYLFVEKAIADTQAQLSHNVDPEMNSLYEEELMHLAEKKDAIEIDLENLMYPSNPYDDKSVFLEIRAGTGGGEAALFAGDLLTMYTNYALSKGWHVSIASMSETDLGGMREVVLHIQGQGAYGHLKYESGVHRVQRVPKTETAGRIHTSTATIAVLPEMDDDVDSTINPSDLRIDVYRSGGAGGQHVNTTDSAVRITHIPTGVVVTCQDERSQHKNKAKALKMLQLRLLTAHQEKQHAQMSEARKELVGRGMRSEKVRTYNYPQNRVTDHQIGLTLNKLDIIMTGRLDEIVEGLMDHDRKERRSKPFVVNAS